MKYQLHMYQFLARMKELRKAGFKGIAIAPEEDARDNEPDVYFPYSLKGSDYQEFLDEVLEHLESQGCFRISLHSSLSLNDSALIDWEY